MFPHACLNHGLCVRGTRRIAHDLGLTLARRGKGATDHKLPVDVMRTHPGSVELVSEACLAVRRGRLASHRESPAALEAFDNSLAAAGLVPALLACLTELVTDVDGTSAIVHMLASAGVSATDSTGTCDRASSASNTGVLTTCLLQSRGNSCGTRSCS